MKKKNQGEKIFPPIRGEKENKKKWFIHSLCICERDKGHVGEIFFSSISIKHYLKSIKILLFELKPQKLATINQNLCISLSQSVSFR